MLRQQAGWSQERLSELMGVSPQQLQKYEAGRNMMNAEKLQQVANALSVPIQALFTATEESIPVGASEQLLLDSFRAIPNKKLQQNILELIVKVAEK